jgi:hypothetical protein
VGDVLYRMKKVKDVCPECKKKDNSSAVRFVRACTDGHLDEIPWNTAVHNGKNKNCSSDKFNWKSGGSSLSDISVECPVCKCKTDIQQVYNTVKTGKCTARFPEKELPSDTAEDPPYMTTPERDYNCDKKMKVLQRQAIALRSSVTITLLTIPEYDDPISNIIQRYIDVIDPYVNANFNGNIINQSNRLSPEDILIINECIRINGNEKLLRNYKHLLGSNNNFMDFVYEEFESLSSTSVPQRTDNFSISKPICVDENGYIPSMLIYPVEKIRTVTAQVGYSRTPPSDPNTPENTDIHTVSSGASFGEDTTVWYPGFEGKGEGLFITFEKTPFIFSSDNESKKAWQSEYDNRSTSKSSGNPLWLDVAKHPLFVWLHTLSHLLIRALSRNSGYSSASLSDRVYVNHTFESGGILIYTTSPGGDGSMGGLVGMVNQNGLFRTIMNAAIENNIFCSNDPLCSETKKYPAKNNGAACYSCLFTSETSCEHRNMWLDRHIILGD